MWSCSKYWFHKHIMFCKCDVALDIDSVFVTSIYHDIIFWKCNLVPNLDFRFINCLHWYKCFLKRISAQTSLPKCYSYYFTFHCMRYIYICSQSIVVLQLAARALYLSAKLFKTSETSNLISPSLWLSQSWCPRQSWNINLNAVLQNQIFCTSKSSSVGNQLSTFAFTQSSLIHEIFISIALNHINGNEVRFAGTWKSSTTENWLSNLAFTAPHLLWHSSREGWWPSLQVHLPSRSLRPHLCFHAIRLECGPGEAVEGVGEVVCRDGKWRETSGLSSRINRLSSIIVVFLTPRPCLIYLSPGRNSS